MSDVPVVGLRGEGDARQGIEEVVPGLSLGMFDVYRDGTFQERVQATGLLSALIVYGQRNPHVNTNAHWTVDRG